MSDDVLERWLVEAAGAVGVEVPGDAARAAVLDLARDVAHNVARPGAPLTTFLLGLAVGQGADLQRAREVLSRLATRSE
jgi:hypothetical protein